MNWNFTARWVLVATIALVSTGTLTSHTLAEDKDQVEVNPRWLDKLDDEDRTALQPIIGYAPADFSDTLDWHNTEPLSWKDLRGKVVVVQSWTVQSHAGRSAPQRLVQSLKAFSSDDVTVIALHTPEGAEKLGRFLENRELDMPIAVDSSGSYCDKLGVYKRPVNIIVDRHGTVRYAGLNTTGVEKAIEKLAAEDFDADKSPKTHKHSKGESGNAEFPPIRGSVGSAKDVRGRRAPDFHVQQWITRRPDPKGKVVIIDFWATWCPPCRAAIPHMNEIADHFGEKVCCVGISNEKRSDFEKGCRKYKLKSSKFHYSLALDPRGKMKRHVRVRGIPHVIVMSSDWVVRWQGHPIRLKKETIEQIIAADNGTSGSRIPSRWADG